MINIKHQLLFIKYLNSYTYLRYYVLHLDFVTSKFSKSLSLLPAKIKITELMEIYGFVFFSWEWNYVVSVTLKAKQMVGFRKITAFFNQNVTNFGILIFFKKNWDSLHARLSSCCKTWSYQKKKHKIKEHRKPL